MNKLLKAARMAGAVNEDNQFKEEVEQYVYFINKANNFDEENDFDRKHLCGRIAMCALYRAAILHAGFSVKPLFENVESLCNILKSINPVYEGLKGSSPFYVWVPKTTQELNTTEEVLNVDSEIIFGKLGSDLSDLVEQLRETAIRSEHIEMIYRKAAKEICSEELWSVIIKKDMHLHELLLTPSLYSKNKCQINPRLNAYM